MVYFSSSKGFLLALALASYVSAAPVLESVRQARPVRTSASTAASTWAAAATSATGSACDGPSIIVAPVISPSLLNDVTVKDVLNDLIVALAGTGTAIVEKDDTSAKVKRDDYVAVVSPVVAPDAASDNTLNDILDDILVGSGSHLAKRGCEQTIVIAPFLSPSVLDGLTVSDILNNANVALAGTGTSIIRGNRKRGDVNVSPDVLNNINVSNLLNDLFAGLALTGTVVQHVNSNNDT